MVMEVACAHLVKYDAKDFIALQVHAVSNPKNVGEKIRWKNSVFKQSNYNHHHLIQFLF
jgi:hypothetical protein